MTSPSSAPDKGPDSQGFDCESAVFQIPKDTSDIGKILSETLASLPANAGGDAPEKPAQASDLLADDSMSKVHAAMQRTLQRALPDLNL